MSKWFYDTSTGTATRAAHCDSLLERAWLIQGISYEGTQWTQVLVSAIYSKAS
jgi:hypothetical protein